MAGLYKLSGVEIVHEHIEPVLGRVTNWVQFTPGSLVIHGRDGQTLSSSDTPTTLSENRIREAVRSLPSSSNGRRSKN